jgi:hypothetical protein
MLALPERARPGVKRGNGEVGKGALAVGAEVVPRGVLAMARQEKYELTDCDKRLAAAVREVHRTYGSNIQKFFEDARKAIEKQRLEREAMQSVQPAGTRSEDYQKQEPLVEFEQYTKRGATVCIRRSVVAGVSAVNVEITNIRDKSGGNFYVAHPIDEVLRRLQIEVERKPIKQPKKPLKRPKKA